jgi:hypothetical protein
LLATPITVPGHHGEHTQLLVVDLVVRQFQFVETVGLTQAKTVMMAQVVQQLVLQAAEQLRHPIVVKLVVAPVKFVAKHLTIIVIPDRHAPLVEPVPSLSSGNIALKLVCQLVKERLTVFWILW